MPPGNHALRLKFGNGFYLTLVKEDEDENGELKSPQPPQIEEELEVRVLDPSELIRMYDRFQHYHS